MSLHCYQNHRIVFKTERGSEQEVHGRINNVAPGKKVLFEPILIGKLELVNDQTKHPDGEYDVAIAGQIAANKEVGFVEAPLELVVLHVAAEVGVKGRIVGGEAVLIDDRWEFEARVEHDEYQNHVGGCECDEFYTRLANEQGNLTNKQNRISCCFFKG